MTFSSEKHEEVCDIIDSYTEPYLDRYIRDEIKATVEPAMKAPGASKITVADAVFFKAKQYEGNIVEAVAVEQLVPVDALRQMCTEIAQALK